MAYNAIQHGVDIALMCDFFLPLTQVELTGSNIQCYIHPEDHQDLFNVLETAKEEMENPSDQPGPSSYTDNIPFFGNQQRK